MSSYDTEDGFIPAARSKGRISLFLSVAGIFLFGIGTIIGLAIGIPKLINKADQYYPGGY